jgi:hypothetical protein
VANQQQTWGEEKDRIRNISRQAGDTVRIIMISISCARLDLSDTGDGTVRGHP